MPGPRTTSKATTRGTTERVLAQFQGPQKIGSDRRGETGGVDGKDQGISWESLHLPLGEQWPISGQVLAVQPTSQTTQDMSILSP